jgi:hypothetical protein
MPEKLRGRTGVWFLATDRLVASDHLDDHFAVVEKLLCPEGGEDSGIKKLCEILERTHSRAHVTCSWRGEPGEPTPRSRTASDRLSSPWPPGIETDFGIDQKP